MVDELEHAAPTLEQEYPEELAAAVKAAVTESELFDSYNMPAKAIPPLEDMLPKAPRDGQLNHRLASLYARVNRFADAATCCDTLAEAYTTAGYKEQAKQYADMAAKYRERVSEAPPPAAAAPVMDAAPPAPAPESAVADFGMMDIAAAEAAPAAPAAREIDLSGEWEQMTSVEQPPAAPEATAQFIGRETAAAAVSSDLAEEIKFYLSQSMWEEARTGIGKLEVLAPGSPDVAALRQQLEAATAAPPAMEVAPAAEPSVAEFTFDTAAQEPVVEAPPPEPPPPPPPPPPAPKPVAAPPPPPKPEAPPPQPVAAPPPPAPKPVAAAPPPAPAADVLGDLVSGLEESLGDDFAIAAPPPAAAKPAAAAPPPQAAALPAAAAPASSFENQEASSALSDMFSEFKEDAEETAGEAEDPDNHYNLGVAFKEMGLLDEAIGELQKVCQAVDKGYPFTQAVQAYTWLAQCFMDKGVPEAAIKWYQKALKSPEIGEEGKLSVYYDLAAAHEATGNKKAALDNFMEVYGANIDYRDVADRIKALKS
ncbi:MAG: hypothetical protein M3O85_04560 [Acidobacteriota bacterium]|nr:hypothetical protein [Acidobacteriota bacterium]